VISSIGKFRFYFLLTTHFYIILYYAFDAIACLKIMFIHWFGVFLISLVDYAYENSRPFWDNSLIADYSCSPEFGSPSNFEFSLLLFVISVYLTFRK